MRKLQIDVSCEGCCAKKQKKNTSQLDFFPFVSTSSLVAHSFQDMGKRALIREGKQASVCELELHMPTLFNLFKSKENPLKTASPH